jgi:hypothetical protein
MCRDEDKIYVPKQKAAAHIGFYLFAVIKEI